MSMDKFFLQKIIDSEFLSEESKTILANEWEKLVEDISQTAERKAKNELKQLFEQELADLTENVDEFVSTRLTEELTILKESVDTNLSSNMVDDSVVKELENKIILLEEENAKLKQSNEAIIEKTIFELDNFVGKQLERETQELRESLEFSRKNEFGMKLYEAFVGTFINANFDIIPTLKQKDDTSEQLVKQLQEESNSNLKNLEALQEEVAELKKFNEKLQRENKIQSLLTPLKGDKRIQMSAILEDVEYDKLETVYNKLVEKVLQANKSYVDLKESAEIDSQGKKPEFHTGDTHRIEPKDEERLKYFQHLRVLAGIEKS